MTARRLVPSLVVVLAGVLASTGLAGCVPTPKANTVDLVGDSLVTQAAWGRGTDFLAGSPRGSNVVIDARPGIGFPDVLVAERKRAAAARPAILVIALGTNDAAAFDGGWNTADEQELGELMGVPSLSTCIVLVIPGYSDKPAVSPTARADLRAAGAAMRRAGAERSAKGRPTVVADWAAVALDQPELTGPDGIHLADDTPSTPDRIVNEAAADAWTAVVWDGVAACPKPTT